MSYIEGTVERHIPGNFSRIYSGTVICFSPTNPSLRRMAAISSDKFNNRECLKNKLFSGINISKKPSEEIDSISKTVQINN